MTLSNQETSESLEETFSRLKSREEPESTAEWGNRFSEQMKARSAEMGLGLPGGLKKAFQQSREYIDSLLPESVQELSKSIQEQEKRMFQPEKGSVQDFFVNPPTAGEIREKGTKKLAKAKFGNADYLEPRNDLEKAAGELNQDLTAMFLGPGQMRMLTRIGAPIAGNLVKEGLKYVGADEKTAEKAKLGTMLAFTLASQSNPQQFARNRIAQGRSMVPQGMTVDAMPLAQSLFPLQQRINRGLNVPSKSRAQQGINELAEQARAGNGRMDMHSLMDARDNINEWISEAGGWDIPAPVRDATVRNLNELKRSVIDTIDNNLATRYPQAGELYRSGYEASAVTHQSNAISNFIERHFGKTIKSIGAKLLFPAAVGGAALVPKGAVAAGVLYPAYKAGQVIYRVSRSPTLAHYYADVIESSIRGNAAEMVHSLSKLDHELEKEEKKRHKTQKISLDEFKEAFTNKD